MEPREFVDAELKAIHQKFDEKKEIYPTVVIVKGNERFPIPVAYQNTAHRDIISQGIKDLVKKSDPDIVIYVAETWAKLIRTAKDRFSSAHSDLDREEFLVVHIEFKSGEKYSCEARIATSPVYNKEDLKIEHNKRSLAEFQFMDYDKTMGRFCDFFPIGRYN